MIDFILRSKWIGINWSVYSACLHDEDGDNRDDLSSVWWRVERVGEEWAGEN